LIGWSNSPKGDHEKVVSGHSVQAVIGRHKLEPDDEGNYRITDDMVDEAEALDKKAGIIRKGLRFIKH